jgi:hypothetical protein
MHRCGLAWIGDRGLRLLGGRGFPAHREHLLCDDDEQYDHQYAGQCHHPPHVEPPVETIVAVRPRLSRR